MFEAWGGYLREAAWQRLQMELTSVQVEQFCRYGELLLTWNQKMNLTAITQPKEVVIKHFIDSLAFGKLLPDFAVGIRLLDIGTGAGFPGIPLKLVNPGLEVVLVDALGKRLKFLQEVIAELGLSGVDTVHARAEEIGRNGEYREKYDVVTARAVARLPVLLEYALPVLKVGGRFLAGKGHQADEEIREADIALQVLSGRVERVERFVLNEEAEHRAIIVVTKIATTAREYPRRIGVPEKKPL